jgi:hypothetical protein
MLRAALVDEHPRHLGAAARNVHLPAADEEPALEGMGGQRLVAGEAVGIRLPAQQEVDDLDQAGLARAVAGLLLVRAWGLRREDDVEALVECHGLEGRQAAADGDDHGAPCPGRTRPSASSTA